MTTLYIDVSHHDWNRRGGNLDWPRVRAATSGVMCARASYGDPTRFAPPTYHFADFQRAAAAAGFDLRGGYHNLVRGDAASMRRQVDWFRRELDAQGCAWAMLDIERYKELVERDLWPRFEDVLRFRDAWHAVESRPLVYYLPRWLWSGYYGGADLRQLPGPLVQSHYLTGVYGSPWEIYNAGGGDSGTGWDDCYGNRCPDIWQYSATCDVPGATSQTDVNAFRGSVDELRARLIGVDDDMGISETDAAYLIYRVEALALGLDKIAAGPEEGRPLPMVQTVSETRDVLKAFIAGEQVRDAATTAAIQALTELVRGGGGSAEAGAILDRISAEATATRTLVVERHNEEMAELRRLHAAQLAERDARAAGLQAELGRLTAAAPQG